MKTGELWTPKKGEMFSYLDNKNLQEHPLGFCVIQLTEYLGGDQWQYDNVGTCNIVMHLRPLGRTVILGEKLFQEWTKIGEAEDKALMQIIEKYRAEQERIQPDFPEE